jgi:hypothetical protein
MTIERTQTTGIFACRDDARRAVLALQAAGFTDDQIGVAGPDTDGLHNAQRTAEHLGESYAGEGAVTGVAAGVGVGALWGIGILAGAIPAIGPAIAGGTLAVLLSSAAAGAAAVGVGGALIGLGISKEDVHYYETELHAGNTLVTVNAATRIDEAAVIIQQHGGQEMAARIAAAMNETDQGEPVIAPASDDVASQGAGHRHAHLDFTSKLPISPAAAQEQLSGLASHAASAPSVARPIAPDEVHFKMPGVEPDDRSGSR